MYTIHDDISYQFTSFVHSPHTTHSWSKNAKTQKRKNAITDYEYEYENEYEYEHDSLLEIASQLTSDYLTI